VAYLVSVTARAERDLALLFYHINANNSDDAPNWYAGLKAAILSLEKHPNRCPATPENSKLRHLLYGRKPHVYRVMWKSCTFATGAA